MTQLNTSTVQLLIWTERSACVRKATGQQKINHVHLYGGVPEIKQSRAHKGVLHREHLNNSGGFSLTQRRILNVVLFCGDWRPM
jgi:hypothetical protein